MGIAAGKELWIGVGSLPPLSWFSNEGDFRAEVSKGGGRIGCSVGDLGD